MHRILGGTVAVLHAGSAALLFGPALRRSSDAEFLNLDASIDSLHHDYVLVGLADALTDGGEALRKIVASRGGVLLALTLHDPTLDTRPVETCGAPDRVPRLSQDVLARGLSGLNAARVVNADGIRLALVEPVRGPGNLASYAWLEVTAEELDEQQPGTSGELALLADVDQSLPEPIAKRAPKATGKRPGKRRKSSRRRLKATLRRLLRNKFSLIGGGLGLSVAAAAAGLAVEGHLLAGFLWGSITALQVAMLYLIVRLRGFLLSQARSSRKFSAATSAAFSVGKAQRGNLMRAIGAVQSEQVAARTLATITLETIDEMRRK